MAEQPDIIVITGTSRGIGRILAHHFLDRGARVYGCSRSDSSIEDSNYSHAIVNVCEEVATTRWIRGIGKAEGQIDVMIGNASAVSVSTPLTLCSGEAFDQLFRTACKGSFLACREASKIMMRKKSGRIITFSSMAEGLHMPGTGLYAASKAAVCELTRIFAKELAGYNITCNAIAPSMIETEAVLELSEKLRAKALDSLTLKRLLVPEEITGLIDYLVSPQAGCITGQVIYMGLVK